jgi:hypothetical protein
MQDDLHIFVTGHSQLAIGIAQKCQAEKISFSKGVRRTWRISNCRARGVILHAGSKDTLRDILPIAAEKTLPFVLLSAGQEHLIPEELCHPVIIMPYSAATIDRPQEYTGVIELAHTIVQCRAALINRVYDPKEILELQEHSLVSGRKLPVT